MIKLAANLSFLFVDRPLLERIDAAAGAGFRGVEFMFPYGEDVPAIAQRLRALGLEQVLFNLPAGNFAGGERGIATDPKRRGEFSEGVSQAIAVAPVLGCTRINCLIGKAVAGVDDATTRRTVVANLREAAKALATHDITLLVEPLNPIETPGFWLDTPAKAFALVDEIGEPNLKVQYDIYHAQRIEGNIIATLREQLPRIGHVQIADSPGRNEPGTGELAYDRIFRELDALGYEGWIGCEYKPLTKTEESFAWIDAFGLRAVTA